MKTYYFAILTIIFFTAGCSYVNSTNPNPIPAKQLSNNEKKHVPPPSGGTDAQASHVSSPDRKTPTTPTTFRDESYSATEIDESPRGMSNPAPKPSQEADETQKAQLLLDEALDTCDAAQSFWQNGEVENAIEALDKAYSLILEVDPLEDPKIVQQKEDLRFLISKRILELYASRRIVVNGKHNEIPLEMNRHVEIEIQHFNTYEKEFFQQAFRRSGKYRSHIVEALKKAGLPEELSWLPLIESGYKAKALSTARALGLWQFIPSTGYKFGLKRNQFVDERIDFVKATDAAIAYLKELHSLFGDWMTVLAAYNCGEGRVLHVIRTQNVNYLDNFWDLYSRLPSETARYVPRFLATLYMAKNPKKYGLDSIVFDDPLSFEEITIARQSHLKDIAASIGVTYEEIAELNPELRFQLLPPESYSLKVPEGKGELLLSNLESIPISRMTPQYDIRDMRIHRVKPGETLATLARRYRTSVNEIRRINNMRATATIRPGQRLKIMAAEYPPQSLTVKSSPSASATETHVVSQGESLFSIAQRYGTNAEKLKAFNQLNSSKLSIGQSLNIPSSAHATQDKSVNKNTYLVRNGDSAFSIAQKHNMELSRFLKLNQLTETSKIHPGQHVIID